MRTAEVPHLTSLSQTLDKVIYIVAQYTEITYQHFKMTWEAFVSSRMLHGLIPLKGTVQYLLKAPLKLIHA